MWVSLMELQCFNISHPGVIPWADQEAIATSEPWLNETQDIIAQMASK